MIILYVEAAGCPDACRHCFALGHPPYGQHFSLTELYALRDEWGPLTIYHEPTAHPDFPDSIHPDLTLPHGGYLVTNGFGLARRADYPAIFRRLKEYGIEKLAFTLHGLREHHDWFVIRKGAFDDVVEAGRRARQAGLQIGWQVFLDRMNITELPELVQLAMAECGEAPDVTIPYHRVSQRLRHYESIRLRREDLVDVPLADLLKDPRKSPLINRPLDDFTAEAWLDAWRRAPNAKDYRHPFEPSTWEPSTGSEFVTLFILRGRGVYFDPLCAPRIKLGELSEGKAVIMERLQKLQSPRHSTIAPECVQLSPEEKNGLHPAGFSVRYLAISHALYDESEGERLSSSPLE